MNDLDQLRQRLREFTDEREWQQFHSPKNLAMALSVEASELLECFQWLTESQSQQLNPEQYQAVSEELSDVLCYLVRLADVLNIDIMQAVDDKMHKNADKYPVSKVKGSAKKYTEY